MSLLAELPDLPRSNVRFFAVRPSPLQFGLARLLLLFRGRDGIAPIGALTVATSWLFGLGVIQLAVVLVKLGPRVALEEAIASGGFVALVLAAGFGALLLASTHARGDLDRSELQGGALIGIGPTDLCCTVRGATTVCAWEHVEILESKLGLIFRLPWRAFYLLPRAALDARDLAALRPLLDAARALRQAHRSCGIVQRA